MKDHREWTIAHMLARRGVLSEKRVTRELLFLNDKNGTTVAHVLAERGILPKEWVTEELLRLKDGYGTTVAHFLAGNGTFPQEWILSSDKRVIKELFRMKNSVGCMVVDFFYDFILIHNRWDLLVPAILDTWYKDKTPMMDKLIKDLSKMNDPDIEEALSLLPKETRLGLLSDLKNPALLEKIRKCLNRDAENEIFETPSQGRNTDNDNIHSGGQENLYGYGEHNSR